LRKFCSPFNIFPNSELELVSFPRKAEKLQIRPRLTNPVTLVAIKSFGILYRARGVVTLAGLAVGEGKLNRDWSGGGRMPSAANLTAFPTLHSRASFSKREVLSTPRAII